MSRHTILNSDSSHSVIGTLANLSTPHTVMSDHTYEHVSPINVTQVLNRLRMRLLTPGTSCMITCDSENVTTIVTQCQEQKLDVSQWDNQAGIHLMEVRMWRRVAPSVVIPLVQLWQTQQGATHETAHAVWPLSFLMLEYVIRHREEFDGKTVLDIGSGTGFNGLQLARLYTSAKVIVSDYSEDLRVILRKNVILNKLEERVETAVVNLFDDTSSDIGTRFPTVDVILAVDLYSEDLGAALLTRLKETVGQRPGLVAYVLYCMRMPEVMIRWVQALKEVSELSFEVLDVLSEPLFEVDCRTVSYGWRITKTTSDSPVK
jgi:predicted nicotinamide N-methyase